MKKRLMQLVPLNTGFLCGKMGENSINNRKRTSKKIYIFAMRREGEVLRGRERILGS